MMQNNKFWDDRVDKFGHTGWADFATYYYDQNLRLNAIENIIVTSGVKCKTALDYGCGTGEFSKKISKYCDKVIATDISDKVIEVAKSENKKNNIVYLTLDNRIFNSEYDLILSITVLQHILDNNELLELIEKFKTSLSPCGSIVVLESFSNADTNSGYMKLRKVDDLIVLFQGAGLKLESLSEFYHPSYMPTELYDKYRRNIFTKLLNKLCHLHVPGIKPILKLMAHFISNKDNGIVGKESITKILVFGK